MNLTRHSVLLAILLIFIFSLPIVAQTDPFYWEIKPEQVSKQFRDYWDYQSKAKRENLQSSNASQKTIRVIYMVPSDKTVRSDYIAAIQNAIVNVQSFYQTQLNGQTGFVIANPVVQVVQTGHPSSWYSTNNLQNASPGTWFFDNSLNDLFTLTGAAFDDPNNRWLTYIDADQQCGQVIGAYRGVALMDANDLRGLTNQSNVPPCQNFGQDHGGINRWIGGLGHELGHTLGLPHPEGCESGNCLEGDYALNSLMYVGYASYPTHLLSNEKISLAGNSFFNPAGPPNSVTGCQAGYSSLGGIISSDSSASVIGNNIYVFARGTDGVLYYQNSNGGAAFSGWQSLGGIINSNPASISDGVMLKVEGLGTDNNRYYQTSTGSTFSGWLQGPATTYTKSSAFLNGVTYNFLKGTGNSPHLCFLAAGSAPPADPVTGCQAGYTSIGGVISSNPTTSVIGNKIYVFARGTDGALYYQTATGNTPFSGWQSLGGIINSNPASTSNGVELRVEGLGTDGNRYYQTTTGSTPFSGWQQGSSMAQTNPSTVFNGVTYSFLKGTGNSPHLCVKTQ